jgi:hypothetical protein
MTEHVPVPPLQGVYNRVRGVHGNTDDITGDDSVLIPLALQGVLKLGQLMGQTNGNIHQCLGDVTGKRQTVETHLNKHFNSMRNCCVHFAAGGC